MSATPDDEVTMLPEEASLVLSEAQAVALPLPGHALREAREALGLSIAEVSHVLKFSARQIDALERDDFSSLTGATFIRGFVRSYARYLKLDEAPLLASLEPKAPAVVSEVLAVEHMGAAMPANVEPASSRRLVVVLVLILASAAAWLTWHRLYAPAETEPAAAAVPEGAASELSSAAPAAVVVQAPMPLTLTEGNVQAPASATVPPPAVAAPNPDERTLAFNFADASWVEVKDASQRVIFTGKYLANTQQVVRGKPPFQLVVGNAAAVKLRYEERTIDLQPYTRAEVARLTLDDNSN